MTENELAEFYMHLETKNAELRALVGELVEGLELLDMNATYLKDESEVMNGPSDRTYKQFDIASSNAKALIAKAKEQVK